MRLLSYDITQHARGPRVTKPRIQLVNKQKTTYELSYRFYLAFRGT